MKDQTDLAEFAYRDYVTIGDVSEILGVSVDTIRRWEKSGKLNAVRLDGKNRYFAVDEIEAFKAMQTLSTTEVAKLLGMSASSVRRLEQLGELVPLRDDKGHRQYAKGAVQDFISRQEVDQSKKTVHARDFTITSILSGLRQGAASIRQMGQSLEYSEAGYIASSPPVKHSNHIAKDIKLPPAKMYAKALIIFGGCIFALFVFFLLVISLFPQKSSTLLGIGDTTDKNLLQKALSPISEAAFGAASSVNPGLYEAVPTQNIQPSINSSSDITLPLSGSSIKSKTITNQQIADGTIQSTQLSPSLVESIRGASGTGKTGAQGPMGATGARGAAGTDGMTGPIGPQGAQGLQGPAGAGVNDVVAGNGLQGGTSGNVATLHVTTGNSTTITNDAIEVSIASSGSTSTMSSASGLEVTNQGLRLVGGCSNGQILKWNGVAWACATDDNSGGGGGSLDIQASDASVTVSGASSLQFGPTSSSSNEFIVQNLGGGQARVRLGSNVLMTTNYTTTLDPTYVNLSEAPATGDISGSFAAGFAVTADAVALGSNTTGNYVASVTGSDGLVATGTGEGAGVSLALDIITAGATSTISSNSGLEIAADGLRLIGGCSAGQVLKWTGTSWLCSNDNGGSAAIDVKENGTTVVAGAGALDFLGTDFAVSSGGTQANVAIDYNNSHITRNNATEIITGNWGFNDNSLTIRDNSDNTKQIQFDLAGVASGTTRMFSAPNVSGTLLTTGNMSDITTTGTITNGVWQGSLIGTQYGGTGINGSLAANGTLLIGNGSGYSLASLTQGAGISIANGAGSISIAAVLGTTVGTSEIENDAVSLGTQTVGNYVSALGTLGGLSVTGNTGEGSTPNLSVLYGSTANTAVQGNTAITVAAGTNLSGGGSITLGAGGTVTLNTTANPTFGTSVTTPLITNNGGLTISTTGAGNNLTLSSANQIILSGFNCSTFDNGGVLTVNSSGVLTCDNDDGGAAGSITGSGTTGRVPLYSGTSSIGNSWIAQNGSAVELDATRNLNLLGGNLSVTGAGTFTSTLTIGGLIAANGGITVEAGDAFTLNGDAFTDLTGNGLTIGSGALMVQYGSTANTAVQGNTSVTVAAGTGLTGGGSLTLGAGGTVTLNTTYGSTANTAVQGSTTLTCASGTGNLTGGGNTITLGSGGTCGSINTTATPTFTSVTAGLLQNTGALGLSTIDTLASDDIVFSTAGIETMRIVEGGDLRFEKGANDVMFSIASPSGAPATYTFSGVSGTVLTSSNYSSTLDSNYINIGESPNTGDIAGSFSGGLTIAANSVALGVDTTGDYISNLGTLTGLSTTGNSGESSSPALSVLYGSTANTAVQGNTQVTFTPGNGLTGGGTITLGAGGSTSFAVAYGSTANTAAQGNTSFTCASGSGNLTGGGTAITVGAGGTCGAITTNNAVSFTTSVSTPLVQSAGIITVGTTATAGADDIIFNTAGTETARILENGDIKFEKGTNDVTLAVDTPSGAAATYTFSGVSGTVLTSSNFAVALDATYVNATESPAAGDISGSFSAGLTINANSVGLGVDTTGDYIANLGTLTGLSTTGNSGEGSTPTLSVLYGSVANTAVQGSTTLTCASGTGNLSGGGNTVTLGAGGTCNAITTNNAVSFSTSVTSPLFTNAGNVTLSATGAGSDLTLSAADQIILSGYNCTGNANGGVLTVSASGVLSCDDDNSSAAGTVTGTGTSGRITYFTGTSTIANSWLNQNSSTLEIDSTRNVSLLGGNLSVTGNGTFTGTLTTSTIQSTGIMMVGTTATAGNDDIVFNTAGAETMRIQEDGQLKFEKGANDAFINIAAPSGAAATYTFSGPTGTVLSTGNYASTLDSVYVNVAENPTAGDIAGSFSAGLTIAADAVALGTDTTGSYVSNIGTLTGLSTTGNSGEGSTPTLSVLYGSSVNTAVQGNTQVTLTAGNGLNGGGTITLGAGGSTSFSVAYGSAANTAVQGNTTLTCASGTGNLSGGGGTITLGTGGTCGTIATNDAVSFATSVTTPLVTNAGALTIQTTGSNDLSLTSGSGIVNLNAGTLRRTAGGTTTIDLLDAAGATVLAVTNSNGSQVANLSVEGTVTAAGFNGNLTGNVTGNASTATALAANPTDCSANQFATAIAANGNLTCAALTDADVPDTLTIGASSTVADGALSANVTKLGTAIDLATAEVNGNLRANNLQSAAADLGAANVTVDLGNSNGAFVTNLTTDGTITAMTFVGALTGNASTATALAANPTDCSANQFANAIAANGNLSCASITDADVSDTLTASIFVGSGSTSAAIDLGTAEVAGILGSTNISGSYTSLTGTGALDAGSITGNFGAINVGADSITTTGTIGTNAATTFNGASMVLSGNINSTSGVIQTNSTTRIANNGDLQNIGSIAMTGSITGTTNIAFNTAAANPTYAEGLLFYDNSQKALSYYNSEAAVTMNIGQENYIYVYNGTGSTISDGQAVYINGTNASVPTVALARADNATTANSVGVATHSIENGTFGFITNFGEINNLNTSGFAAGDTLYLSATTAGLLTNVRPAIPNHTVQLGRVTEVNASTGKILVLVGSSRNGALTAGRIAFGGTDGNFIEDSELFWDNTTKRLGIGDSTPAATLTVGNGDLFQVAGATGNISTSGSLAVTNAATTGTVQSVVANSLTSGKGISVTTSATALTGSLVDIIASGNNAANTGNLLNVSNGSNASNAHTLVQFTNGGTGLSFRVNDDGTTTDTTPFSINAAGQVGVGTTGQNDALDVVGSIDATTGYKVNGVAGATVAATCGNNQYISGAKLTGGILTAANGCTNDGVSDGRVKTNVVEVNSVLSGLKEVNIVNFDFDCSTEIYQSTNYSCDETRQTGVIAQELLETFPELVTVDKFGLYNVNYKALNMYTIKGVQELSGKVDELMAVQDQVDSLESRIDSLESNMTTGNSGTTSFDELTVGMMTVNTDLFTQGALVVEGDATFNAQAFFNELVTFGNNVIFGKGVEFRDEVSFSNNNGGYARIEAGQQTVHVSFTKPFTQTPVISLTLMDGRFAQYSYTNVTAEGFDIVLNAPAVEQLQFSWIGLNVMSPVTTQQPLAVTP